MERGQASPATVLQTLYHFDLAALSGERLDTHVMKRYLTKTALLVTVFLLASLPGLCAPAPANSFLDIVSPLARQWQMELAAAPKTVLLPGGFKAETVVLRQVRWELKSLPQSVALSQQMDQEARRLPEAERLKSMNRIADHLQLWAVSLANHPQAGAALKDLLLLTPEPHEYYRELAFLGRGQGRAWYAFMPIYEWVPLQKQWRLESGDDPLAAAARGLDVVDRGHMTANSMDSFLTDAGTNAFPYLRPVLESTNSYRGLGILARIPGWEATAWLLRCARSTNAPLAANTRHLLTFYARPEAEEIYFQWLKEDAGKVSTLTLLDTCAKINKPRVGPFLLRILTSPRDPYELRTAFELSRSLAGRNIPADLMQAEGTIKRHGYRSGPNYDPAKVDQAVTVLSQTQDTEAAAQIGLSLVLATTKGDWRPANDAGWRILKDLPHDQGRRLAKTLFASCPDESVKEKLKDALEP